MKTQLADCSFLVNKWRANKIELNQIAALSGFDRELHRDRAVPEPVFHHRQPWMRAKRQWRRWFPNRSRPCGGGQYDI